MMFMVNVQTTDNFSNRLNTQFKLLEKTFGAVPPHFKMLATLDPSETERTLDYLFGLMRHPTIDLNLFPFLRLHVAIRENYRYCIDFNTKLLKSRGYSDDIIDQAGCDIASVPFVERVKALAIKGIKAIYAPGDFNSEDLQELYRDDWNDSDIFDVINHAAFLLKNGRILSAYTV